MLIGTVMIADRINDGDVRKVVLEKVAVLKPELSRNQQQQAWRTASAHVRQEGHLKQTQVKSQATTSARSACTVEQQWRWHQLIDHIDNQHRRINISDDAGVWTSRRSNRLSRSTATKRAFSHVPAMASKSTAVDPEINTRRTRRIRGIRSACSSVAQQRVGVGRLYFC